MEYMDYLANMPQQIMDATAFVPENIKNFIALALCMTFGYLLYVWAVRLLIVEKVDPYPIWLHSWMITIDIIGTITFWKLAFTYDFFWLFLLFGIGLPIWVFMEAYCIYKGVKNARQEHFGLFEQKAYQREAGLGLRPWNGRGVFWHQRMDVFDARRRLQRWYLHGLPLY
jgi:hypothetical protein